MEVARSATARSNSELTRQMRLGAGRKRRDLLVPHMDPLDLALTPYRIRQAVQAVANNPVDPLDARCGERLRKLIGMVVAILASPFPVSERVVRRNHSRRGSLLVGASGSWSARQLRYFVPNRASSRSISLTNFRAISSGSLRLRAIR